MKNRREQPDLSADDLEPVMQFSPFSHFPLHRLLRSLIVLTLTGLLLATWYLTNKSSSPAKVSADNTSSQNFEAIPPWRYGKANSRFTLVLYADLECPFCKSYYPELRAWVDRNPDTNLQWHHLPLPMHAPAATRQARLVECAGEAEGSHCVLAGCHLGLSANPQ